MKIEGYAVICDNDCIADSEGKMPDSLKSEAEWAYFQAGLDAADIIVLGRRSHEVTPNPKQRARLVLTSKVDQPEWCDELTVFWNPSKAALRLALSMFAIEVETLAITGGQPVFDHFLTRPEGYSCFHLSRMKDVYLQRGVKLFSGLHEPTVTAEQHLKASGYAPSAWEQLDEQASVVRWQPDG